MGVEQMDGTCAVTVVCDRGFALDPASNTCMCHPPMAEQMDGTCAVTVVCDRGFAVDPASNTCMCHPPMVEQADGTCATPVVCPMDMCPNGESRNPTDCSCPEPVCDECVAPFVHDPSTPCGCMCALDCRTG